MNNFNNILKNIKNHDIILGIILLIYILGGYQTPHEMSQYINSFIGYIIMLVIFIISLKNSNIVISLLLGFAFIVLIQRSQLTHPTNVMPSQNYRDDVMNNLNTDNKFNSLPLNNDILNNVYSGGSNIELEQLIVENMATVNYQDQNVPSNTYQPVMSNDNNAFDITSIE